MKKFNVVYLIGLLTTILYTNVQAVDSVITLFIKKDTAETKDLVHDNTSDLVSAILPQPSYLFKGHHQHDLSDSVGVSGIQAIYLGYLANSTKNGQISFPRKQQSDQINILITPKIAPVFMIKPSLIHHWTVDTSQPMAMYEINRKKDKKLKTYYFDVVNMKEAIENKNFDQTKSSMYQSILTGKKEIPLNTIIILADPENITLPTGITYNHYSPNFILPVLTAKEFDSTQNSLYTLSIKQYFEQVNIANKSDTADVITMITNQ